MIGRVLSNRYKLIAQLGSGGMAWIYLAEDQRDGQRVAVKILYPQLGQDLGFLQRFTQEARLVMSLSRSAPEMHVVSVLDYGSDRDVHYLVMEYVPGQDIRQVLDQWRTLAWQEAFDIARQVALALGHAHRHGVVHRDVKPENIMLLPDGAVRVLDFGVARARSSPTLTQSGFVGSPYYAAPEQIMGQPVDIRADIYALGIVLYEMLAGSRPHKFDAPWTVITPQVASPPPPLEEARPGLPPVVCRLVRRAMARRPEDRFQTPGEMLEALEAVLAGREWTPAASSSAAQELAAGLEGLYQRASQAGERQDWPEAVDLLSQILRLDPRYRDVVEELAEAGRQARLAALYAGAQQSLQAGDAGEVLAQLAEIAQLSPGYRDVEALQAKARRQVVAMGRAGKEKQRAATPARRRNLLWAIAAVLLLALVTESYLLYRSQQPRVVAAVPATATATAPPTETATPLPTATLPARATQPATPSALPTEQAARPTSTDTKSPPPATTARPTTTPNTTPTISPSATSTPAATPTPAPAGPTEPPLSGQIAFPRFDAERGTYDVYVCQVEGAACRQVAAQASQPDFVAGGSQLVLHSWQPDRKGLVLQTLSGQRLWELTGALEAARPSADRDGSAYVYHSRQESDRQPRLYRTYGLETRPLLYEGGAIAGQSPSWTPEGAILFSGCWQDTCGILAIDADGTHPRQIVAGSAEANPEASPGGAPGGQQIAFMSQRDGNWEVYIVGADGGRLRRLTAHPANDGLPTWSPDGRWLAFVSDRGGRWAIWAVRPDGSGLRHLFDLGGSLDGRVQAAAPHETNGWVEERISWVPLP